MTTLEERSRTKGGSVAFTPGQPQVNLLPPEIRAARGLRTVKRLLAASIVLVVLLCAVGWAYTWNDKRTAAASLADAQSQTVRLQAEQRKYAEVPRLLGALSNTERARSLGMATEVLWSPYCLAIAATLPAGVSFDAIAVKAATPMAAAAAASAASPLIAPSVGQIQFTARSKTLPDTAAWMDALDAIPGLGDAWVSAVGIQQGVNAADVYYQVTATVQIRDAAYAHRFVETAGAN